MPTSLLKVQITLVTDGRPHPPPETEVGERRRDRVPGERRARCGDAAAVELNLGETRARRAESGQASQGDDEAARRGRVDDVDLAQARVDRGPCCRG
jgi:hypothetical protein